MLDPRVQPAIWLLPETMTLRPHGLEALRRILHRVDIVAIFERVDHRGVASIPAHQPFLGR